MTAMASDWEREFIFTDKDFHTLKELVNRHTGIALSDAKRELVYSRLTRRLRELKLKSFSKYCELLLDDTHTDEVVHFTNAVTTNLTSFFREPHHFEYIIKHVLPDIAKRPPEQRRVRFWSAGCSTGEEPYSLAMTLKEHFAGLNNFDVKILATDLASSVLDTAINGIYPAEKLKTIPPHRQNEFFKRDRLNYELMRIKPAIQNLITFRRLNLMDHWPMKGPFEMIFCRNVLIYFDKTTQRALVDRFANLLPDNGYLLLGHSESLFKVTDRFRLVGQTIYQKIK
ncbi:MAG: protein-glutamate O-methyltransferase [Gammaproteobacteria bacterium]|jgi:chemotaxis protein methyltransferase CheR